MEKYLPDQYLVAIIAIVAIASITVMASVPAFAPMGIPEMTMTGQYIGIGHAINEKFMTAKASEPKFKELRREINEQTIRP